MVNETQIQNLRMPVPGQTRNWGEVLNQSLESIDEKLVVRDTEANRSEYPARGGMLYFSTDTGTWYVGDGDTWQAKETTTNTLDPRKLAAQGVATAHPIDAGPETFDCNTAPADTITNAVDYLDTNGGGTLRLPDATETQPYVAITNPIDIAPSEKIHFKGGVLRNEIEYGDPSTVDQNPEGLTPGVFEIGQEEVSTGDTTTLTANLNKNNGEDVVSVADASIFSEGDFINIQSATDNVQQNGQQAGESNRVVSVDTGANTVELEQPITMDHNSADDNTVRRYAPVSVDFTGTEIYARKARVDAEEYTRGIRLIRTVDCEITECHIHDMVVAGVMLLGSYKTRIYDNHIEDIFQAQSSGYGVVNSEEVRDCVISENLIERCRHQVAGYNSGGGSQGMPQYTIRNNTLRSEGNSCVDAHGGVWRMDVINNEAHGTGESRFCASGGSHTTVADNDLHDFRFLTDPRGNGEHDFGTWKVKNNRCEDFHGGVLFKGEKVFDTVVIQGNTYVNLTGWHIRFFGNLGEDGSYKDSSTWNNIVIKDEVVDCEDTAAQTIRIDEANTDRTLVERIEVKNCHWFEMNIGCEIDYMDNVEWANNSWHGTDYAVTIRNANRVYIHNNKMEFQFSNDAGVLVPSGETPTDVYIDDNYMIDYNSTVEDPDATIPAGNIRNNRLV